MDQSQLLWSASAWVIVTFPVKCMLGRGAVCDVLQLTFTLAMCDGEAQTTQHCTLSVND